MEYKIEFTREELDEIRKLLREHMYDIYSSYAIEQVFGVFKDGGVQSQYMDAFKDYERLDAFIEESIAAFSENNTVYDSNSIISISFSEDDCDCIQTLLQLWITYRETWNSKDEESKRSLRIMREISSKMDKKIKK